MQIGEPVGLLLTITNPTQGVIPPRVAGSPIGLLLSLTVASSVTHGSRRAYSQGIRGRLQTGSRVINQVGRRGEDLVDD